MAAVGWILVFISVAGRLLSSTSPVLHSAPVVPVGGNASLTCNLTSTSEVGLQVTSTSEVTYNLSSTSEVTCDPTSTFEVSWYRLHSDRLLPLLTVRPTRLGGPAINFHSEDRRLSATGGAVVGDPVHLGLHQVAPQDAGLYFCTARCGRSVGVAAIRLVVDGEEDFTVYVSREDDVAFRDTRDGLKETRPNKRTTWPSGDKVL